jgi:hypothetical protein
MARGISSKLRGSMRVTSAVVVEMPGMPITLVPAKGSSLAKSELSARELLRLMGLAGSGASLCS